MEIFLMTVHTDDGNEVTFEIDAATLDKALYLLWEKKSNDRIGIDTNMSYTEFVGANRIVKVKVTAEVTETKPKIKLGDMPKAFGSGF